ncbi:MAG: aminotransferase class IV [Leadbetterella sp.]
MSLFFESIKVLDGKIFALDLHEKRANNTIFERFWHLPSYSFRAYALQIPLPQKGLFKLRINYSEQEIESYDLSPYSFQHPRIVGLVEKDDIQYSSKYSDRSILGFDTTQMDDAIFIKNSLLTDATYSNIALYDGNKWFTPKKCLLKGTKRRALIEQNTIFEKSISPMDLGSFSLISFINAMRDLELHYTFKIKDNLLQLSQ